MAQDDAGPDGEYGGGAVSIGEEDQLREAEMEHEQRQEDDGVPPPADAGVQRGKPLRAAQPRRQQQQSGLEDTGPWTGRADEPGHPGQTSEGGLGGSGPVQP